MKAIMTCNCKLAVAAALFSGGLFSYGLAQAAQLSIHPVPLFIGATGVAPNVFITLDDSGSMDWEFTTNRHWQANFYDWDIVDTTLENTLGSSSVPSDNVPGSQKRFYGYGTNSGDSAYTGRQSILFSYYYGKRDTIGGVNSDNVYDGDDANSCESGDGNGRAIYNCNNTYTLWRPDKRTNPITPQTGILWDWRVFSSDLNVLYYSPGATYDPWKGMTENASYTAARSNPKSNDPTAGTAGYTVTRDLSATDFYYAVWHDNKGFAGTAPGRGNNAVSDSTSTTDGHMISTPNGYVDLWDNYTLYTVKAGATDTITVQTFQTETCKTVTPVPTHKITADFSVLSGTNLDQDDPRCWYYCTSDKNNRTGSCNTPNNFQYRYQKGRLVVSPVGSATTLTGTGSHSELGGKTIAEVKQSIANWYQYYRRRSLVAKGSLGQVITQFPNFRYGISVLNEWSGSWPSKLFVQMPATPTPPFTTHNADLLQKMYGFAWTASGTPLQAALGRSGQYFNNTLSNKPTPILPAAQGGECQQNFSLLTSDGYWNAAYSAMGDKDSDGKSNTLADVAHYYYTTDLSSSLADKVITTPFDYARWQHMVTFTVGFGVEGFFNYPTASGWPAEVNPLSESGDWGDPTASDTTPAKIDDMWHAAYNGRGTFVSARNPAELVDGLSQALSTVSSRVGSAAALSLNAGFVTNVKTATSYLARFNSADWTGQMLAVTFKSDGTFDTGAPVWDTGSTGSAFAIKAPSSRTIFTRTSAGTGVEFLWANLDTAQQNALNTIPTSSTPCSTTNLTACDGKGPERLEFLRGKGVAPADSAWLTANNFRTRSSMLGDIINSDPFFVDGSPPMVYVGANDGMLHAFNANTGEEVFAYVPTAVFKRLNAIPGKNYAHNYTVDGSAVVREVNGKKILVGTLRGGGQAAYALDVTDPTTFNASKVLWEYSDNDLGYTFSKPTIAKLGDQWAVFLGNGYNNTEADGSASTTGTAVLYVLNVETGVLIQKINTGAGSATTPNGLATPAVIFDPSEQNPSSAPVKYAYAGDLLGNLWKFDLNAGNVAYDGKALFTAKSPDTGNPAQPITIRPEVSLHPSRGYLVYFGTGKYFETGDNSTTNPTQTLYAVWDRAWGEKTGDTPSTPGTLVPQTRAHLLPQAIVSKVSIPPNSGYFYVTDDKTIIWHDDLATNPTGTPPTTHLGFYMDLTFGGNNQGEKQVTNGLLLENKIIFNTIIPSSGLCDAGGTSNTVILDAISGSRLKTSPFNGLPLVDHDNDPTTPDVPVSSKPSIVGILSSPTPIFSDDGRIGPPSLGSSGQPDSFEFDPLQQTFGRQFWRQLQQ